MSTLLRDLRHTLRRLRHQPAFGLTAVSTIALAVAANTLMFALVRGILLSPLPLPEAERLVRIEQVHRAGPSNVTGATFVDLRAESRTLASAAAFRVSPATLSADDQAFQASATAMTADYFAVLGLRPVAGRLPSAEDFVSGGAPVVFISRAMSRRLFGTDGAGVGRLPMVNAAKRIVAGIVDVPASTPGASDAWIPVVNDAPLLRNRRAQLYTVIGRLRPGTSAAACASELDALARAIRLANPQARDDLSLRAAPLQARMVESVRPTLLVLWAAVGVLLVIAFGNLTNLLLMQGSARVRELSIRTALGASRRELAAQLALESAVLGTIGGLAGSSLGAWGVLIVRSVLPSSLPRVADIHVDAGVVLFGVCVSVAAAILFGLLPAARLSASGPASALRTRDTETSGARVRDMLVAAEVALTLVLLFAAGLLGRSLLVVSRVPLGFDPQQVAAVDISLPGARYSGVDEHRQFYDAVLASLAGTPGLEGLGVTGALPLGPTAATTMVPQGGRDDQQSDADVIPVTPGFFPALRVPLVRGRLIAEHDLAQTLPVAMINDAAARQFWPAGVDPIGRTIEMRDWGAPYSATIVGIVGNVRQEGPDQPVAPAVYFPTAQFPQTTLTETIVARSGSPADAIVARIRDAVRGVDPTQPLARSGAMSNRIAAALAPRRFNLMLLGAFAAAALLLAAVGIYGVVAFAMASRTREIGIRVALGAAPRHIAWLTFVRGALPVAVGLVAGLATCMAAARFFQALVYGVPPRDPVSLVIAVSLVGSAALIAVAGPARRAKRVDPVTALRAE